MSIKKIKKNNPQQFLDDLKRVVDVMMCTDDGLCFHIKKREVLEAAEHNKIDYVMSDIVFLNRRVVMVVF